MSDTLYYLILSMINVTLVRNRFIIMRNKTVSQAMSELRLLFLMTHLLKFFCLIVLGLSPDFCRAEFNEPFHFLMTQCHEIAGMKKYVVLVSSAGVYTILSLYRLLSGRIR